MSGRQGQAGSNAFVSFRSSDSLTDDVLKFRITLYTLYHLAINEKGGHRTYLSNLTFEHIAKYLIAQIPIQQVALEFFKIQLKVGRIFQKEGSGIGNTRPFALLGEQSFIHFPKFHL